MYKKSLRSTLKSIATALPTLLLALSLVLPLCPVYADNEPPTDRAIDSDLPVWSGYSASEFTSGSGARYDPYQIGSPEELAYLAECVNNGENFDGQYFRLTADLYLNDPSSNTDPEKSPLPNEWTPIGGYRTLSIADEEAYLEAIESHQTLYLRTENGYSPTDSYIKNAVYYRLATFNGHFDGDEHSIYGLYLSTDAPCAGLFGACTDAEIIDLTLSDAYLSGSDEIGALIGRLNGEQSAEIRNCHIEGKLVAAGSMAGGIVGNYIAHSAQAAASVTDSSFSGELKADSLAGGILGNAQYSVGAGSVSIEDCESDAYITARSTVGGIAGGIALPAALLGCTAQGSGLADTNVGGIVGELNTDTGYITLSECRNFSSLVGQDSVGGIAGRILAAIDSDDLSEADMTNANTVVELLGSSNLGDLFGSKSAGGIAGSCSAHEGATINLTGCKNSATVSGKLEAGGIAGSLSADGGKITLGSAENYGDISSDSMAGGIVGFASSTADLNLYQCFSYATVSASKQYAGGIAGRIAITESGYFLLELSCSNGQIKAARSVGGIAGELFAEDSASRSIVKNCFSSAQLTAEENAGGIAGSVEVTSGQAVVENALFVGSFTSGNKLTGGIAAYIHAQNTDATVQINQCYYLQNAAGRTALLYGGKGSELCQSSFGLNEDAFRSSEQMVGLDFSTVWQPSNEENRYPILRAVPFVWENFIYVANGQSASLLAYQGRSDIVEIPSKLGGIALTTIEASAFAGSPVVEVILPDSVTTIGKLAFADCDRLRSITLPASSRIVVAAGAFKNCSALETRRSASSLDDIYIDDDNEYFKSIPLVRPITLNTEFLYEDGSTAAKGGTITCYQGEYYLIDAPEITGYKADINTLVGICTKSQTVGVIYRLGSYQLTVRYLFPDGSEAAESYTATYRFGEFYSIIPPEVSGYLPANTLIEGTMEGEDLVLTVYYSEALVNVAPERSTHQSLLIALLIFASFALVCCIAYFIFRYRSNHTSQAEESDFDSLFTPRF